MTKTGGRPATRGVIAGKLLSVGLPSTDAPAGFKWTALSDVARLETGHTPSRKVPEYWDGDVPWVGIRDATHNHGRTIFATRERITDAGLANSSARLLPAGTVCLSRTASVGFVVTMGIPMATSQDFVNWVCGPRIDNRYLKYVLVAEHQTMLRFASGTTHQTIYFPEAKAFHVCLPSLGVQQDVADILSSLDDKIESNRRIVTVSSSLARHLASSGETRCRVTDVAAIEKGLSYTGAGLVERGGVPMVNLANFGVDGWLHRDGLKSYAGDHKAKHTVCAGDLVVANTDLTQQRLILGRPALVPSDLPRLLFTHHVFAVRFHSDPSLAVPLWAALNGSEFRDRAEGYATGTTVAGLPRDALLDFEFAIPDPATLAEATQLIERAWMAELEMSSLAELRDFLAPELLSGRVALPEEAEPVGVR